MATTRDWDAASYQRVSIPHEEWARSIFARLDLSGEETVLDAGCGSGRVTGLLIEQLPRGRVIAVDGSPSMVVKVREVLRPQDEAVTADLSAIELDEGVDAIFSSAVFHWIADHDLLFRRLGATLKPGGQLAAQCGGAGNIERLRATSEGIASREPYAPHFEGFGGPWHYAGAKETEARLERAGFADACCWLQPWQVIPSEPGEFLRTVCLGPHMDRLPEPLRDTFIADVLEAEKEPLTLDYVRLNIDARAAA